MAVPCCYGRLVPGYIHILNYPHDDSDGNDDHGDDDDDDDHDDDDGHDEISRIR